MQYRDGYIQNWCIAPKQRMCAHIYTAGPLECHMCVLRRSIGGKICEPPRQSAFIAKFGCVRERSYFTCGAQHFLNVEYINARWLNEVIWTRELAINHPLKSL